MDTVQWPLPQKQKERKRWTKTKTKKTTTKKDEITDRETYVQSNFTST